MKAIILAGGFGTRLREIIGEGIPKPMAMISGKPFLEHQIRLLRDQGIKDIILAVHYKPEEIKSFFGNGSFFGVNITYSEEEIPLGTAGAIKKAEKYIDDTFLVLNGDTYSSIDIQKFLEFHKSNFNKFTIGLTKSNSAVEFGAVITEGDKIIEFSEKEVENGSLVNCGVYIFEPEIFNYIESGKNTSLEKDIFPLFAEKRLLKGYQYEGYFMDIARPETYKKFKEDMINNLCLFKKNKIRSAMEKITRSGMDIIMVIDENKKLLGILNDKIIKRFILAGGNIEDELTKAMVDLKEIQYVTIDDPEEKSNNFFMSGTNRLPVLDKDGKVVDLKFKAEIVNKEVYPILRGKAPLRISFAGGVTDLPYFFEKYGGAVINSTIDKYCHATLIKRADSKIIINSEMNPEVIFDYNNIIYDGKFDLIKAIVKLMQPKCGFELYLHNDIPPGRGLGSSASLAVLIVSLLCRLQNIKYDENKIAEIAYKAETEELGIKGGWQDQYAAVTGGFSYMEFTDCKTLIYPLRLKEDVINELSHHILLCYVGSSHSSGEMHKNQENSYKRNEEETVDHLKEMKRIAIEIKDALLTGSLEKIGLLLHESWNHKRKIDKCISNSKIDLLYEIGIKNGAYGGKLLGAGGGGYLLFFHPPTKRNQIKKSLEELGVEAISFNFESKGTNVWAVK